MKEKQIKTEWGTVHYWVSEAWHAERETMFFFPGLTADHTMFADQWLYFENRYNIITWDAPCHGKSRPYQGFSFEQISRVLVRILRENHVKQIIGIGQSLGGYCVQALLCRHPEMVKAMIGIGTTPYGEQYYSSIDKFWLRQVEWMSMCYPLTVLKKAVAKQATCTAAGYHNMMEMAAVYQKREYCHLMQMAYDAFLADNRNLTIPCPVLITYGEYDRVGKVRQYCQQWHKRAGYPLVVIRHAGHNANVDNPAEMNRTIEAFLARKQ